MARKRRRGIRSALVLIALLVLAGLGIFLYVTREWRGPGPAARPLTVTVANGSTLSGAARELEKAGAIRSRGRFLRLVRLFGTDAPIRAGEYEVPAQASAADIHPCRAG